MSWNNPAMSWSELEKRLSGLPGADDGPVSRKRRPVAKRPITAPSEVTPYAELHCHSHFSFLDGASSPADLVEEAVRLGLHALAITDHDGFHGAPLFAEAAAVHGLATVYGAELSLGLTGPQNGVPDPEGSHLLVLARGVEGYHRLSGAMTEAHLRGDEKGRPVYDLDELGEQGRGHWAVLTGCRKGAVRQALDRDGTAAAAAALDRLTATFGLEHVLVELSPRPGADATNAALAALARDHGLDVVAAGNVHHATPDEHRLAGAMAAVRSRRSLADLDGWLDLSASAHLRSGAETAQALAPFPGAVARSVTLADELAFDLRKASPSLPKQQIPEGHTPDSWLRVLADRGFAERYAHTPHAAEARDAARARAPGDLLEGLRRLLRDRARHRRLRPRPRHPLPGEGLGSELGGLLRPRHHRRRRGLLPAALRAVHLRPPRRGARHRRRLRLRPARGGHPVGLRHLRPTQRRPGRQRDRLPTPDGGA